MRLFELFEQQKTPENGTVFVVYGGGFQPFHRGHFGSYQQAKNQFHDADFYVVASNDTKVRPIPFVDKKFLAREAGVEDPFVEVKAPINPREIMKDYDAERDIFILVRSERDPMSYTKKDGSPGYYQPFVDINSCEPFGRHGYVYVTQKVDFSVAGQEIYSGSQVRQMYQDANDDLRMMMIQDLYPESRQHDKIKDMLDRYF
jgi:hypothetical protein